MALIRMIAALITANLCASAGMAAERPRVYTNEQYIEDVSRQTDVPLQDPKAMLAFVLDSLPPRVRVYPTENYYYFHFYHNGTRYAGNIRLDAKDRDEGKLHFAYFAELTEWRQDSTVTYRLFGEEDGVEIEKLGPLVYRVSVEGKSVVFMLNDLSNVTPPASSIGPDDQYLGPVFDESGLRFFLIFNRRLRIFHYVLDETVKVADEFIPTRFTERILIGRRTGFAFYRDHRIDRRILIGVFEAGASVNSYLDGPFDQLPDNFIKGDELRQAIIAADPTQKGKIDRFGGTPDGESRFLIGPYMYYRSEDDLRPIHDCATDKSIPRELYHACFVISAAQHGVGQDGADGAAPSAEPDAGKTKRGARKPKE